MAEVATEASTEYLGTLLGYYEEEISGEAGSTQAVPGVADFELFRHDRKSQLHIGVAVKKVKPQRYGIDHGLWGNLF
jgi:hypothetical protein